MISTLLGDVCSYCEIPQLRIFLCAGCKVVHYCSRVHQRADKPDHESQCVATKKARNKVRREEVRLHRIDPWAFEMSVGVFWGDHDTRPYMRARADFIEEVSQFKTKDAVETALEFALENLRLSTSDNMGTRDWVPALLIRLGRDQEAYNFIKWWEMSQHRRPASYLDMDDQDVFGDVVVAPQPRLGESLAFKSAIYLIKYRMINDLGFLQREIARGEEAHEDLVEAIDNGRMDSAVITNEALMEAVEAGRDPEPWLVAVEDQLLSMFNVIQQHNKHFWHRLAESDGDLNSIPEWFALGNQEEVTAVLCQSTYAAWDESPGAIEHVRGMLSEDE